MVAPIVEIVVLCRKGLWERPFVHLHTGKTANGE